MTRCLHIDLGAYRALEGHGRASQQEAVESRARSYGVRRKIRKKTCTLLEGRGPAHVFQVPRMMYGIRTKEYPSSIQKYIRLVYVLNRNGVIVALTHYERRNKTCLVVSCQKPSIKSIDPMEKQRFSIRFKKYMCLKRSASIEQGLIELLISAVRRPSRAEPVEAYY